MTIYREKLLNEHKPEPPKSNGSPVIASKVIVKTE
jgi:hypothetical protein